MKCTWHSILTAAIMGSLAGNACAQTSSSEKTSDRHILDSLARKHPCRPMSFPVSTLPDPTKLSRSDRCTLVTTAFDYVRKGAAKRAGMNPGDTAAIERSRVIAFTFKNLSGGASESYWNVDFLLSNRSYAIAVRIDRHTGTVRVGRAEREDELPSRN